MGEFWVRDPLGFIEECANAQVRNIIWEGRVLDFRTIDPQAYLEMHYPPSFDYRILVVRPDGSPEFRRGYSTDVPFAVYQTWFYDNDTLDELEEMLANPSGQDLAACTDGTTPSSSRPVFGQEPRIIIAGWPDATSNLGRSFLRALQEYQKDYPDVLIHLWGSASYKCSFGLRFAAGDADPSLFVKDRIWLPNGKQIKLEQMASVGQWIRLLGFSVSEMTDKSKRIEYNIRSAEWASKFWETDLKFKSSGNDPVDPNSHHHLPATTASVMSRSIKSGLGDKNVCDTCSLFATCKYYREGSVCSLPGTDNAKLAGYFATRNADQIIEGLGKVVAAQATRFERALDAEEFSDELDANVTRLGHILVDDGVKLAKLVDPRLAAAGAARVTAFIGGQHLHQNGTPNSIMANIVREIEAQGTPREEITEDMVKAHILQEQAKLSAIEATSQ